MALQIVNSSDQQRAINYLLSIYKISPNYYQGIIFSLKGLFILPVSTLCTIGDHQAI